MTKMWQPFYQKRSWYRYFRFVLWWTWWRFFCFWFASFCTQICNFL